MSGTVRSIVLILSRKTQDIIIEQVDLLSKKIDALAEKVDEVFEKMNMMTMQRDEIEEVRFEQGRETQLRY